MPVEEQHVSMLIEPQAQLHISPIIAKFIETKMVIEAKIFLKILPKGFETALMESYNKGNEDFVAEDYEAAIESYTVALLEMPEHAAAYLNRGTARLKLKKLYEALEVNYSQY